MRLLLLVNPRSGMGDSLLLARAAWEVFRAAGWEVYLMAPPHPQGFLWAARYAATHNIQRVVAVGGDGTFRWAAAGLRNMTGTALGILPAGTGNVLARYLGMPIPGLTRRMSTMRRAAEKLLQGRIQTWDLFRVNRNWGLLWAGMGLDAAVVAAVESHRRGNGRPLIRTWGHFVTQVFRQLWTWAPCPVTLYEDHPTWQGTSWMVVLANVPLFAGGLIRFPQGVPTDGRMELWPLIASSPQHILGQVFRTLRKEGLPLVWPWEGRQVEQAHLIFSEAWPLYCDGDPLPPAREVRVSLFPRALRMWVPD